MEQDAASLHRGLIQVYTGNGKGKTTAAFGLALRAIGRGKRVAVVQFLKPGKSGERIAAEEHLPALQVFGETRPYDVTADQRTSGQVRDDSRRNFDLARALLSSGEWDVMILDEVNLVLYYGFVTREEMLDVLNSRSRHTEVVVTGRYAPEWLLEAADLVTEMVDVKHPSGNGVGARNGIEY